jgi:DNA-binding response OmpR family regulator
MSRLSYDSAETLIYDPVSANRTATRSALYSLGFRKIESVATVETFAEAIRRRPPDLAICECQGAEAQLCDLIQFMRQGAPGYNPFIVIIATAWEKNATLVSRVINSGADDLLLRPFSTALLGQRIDTHTEKRKGFVITTDYVGPDRRKDPTRESNVDLFEPPNSLKMKAKERLTQEEVTQRLDSELRTAREMLNAEKLRRDAFQVCILWRLMQEQKPGAPKYEAELQKLAGLAKSIGKRCRDADLDMAMEWCDGILSAVEGLELGVDRNASMHLLGHGSLNLLQVLMPAKSPAEHLAEVNSTVATINARAQAALQSSIRAAAAAAAQPPTEPLQAAS